MKLTEEEVERLRQEVDAACQKQSDEALEKSMPFVEWRVPIEVSTTDGKFGYLCKYCLAKYGHKAEDTGKLPQTKEAFQTHLAEMHPRARA